MADYFLSNDFRSPHKCWDSKIFRVSQGKHPSYESLLQTEWNETFDKLAKGKMIQASFRYGLLKDNNSYDFIEAMKNKIRRYEATHNLELLVDIRNYAMLEFKKPKYPDAYYYAEQALDQAPLKNN